MPEHKTTNVPERDKLMTRPSAAPLPSVQDPKKPRGEPDDPKPDTNQVEKSKDLDYTA